MVGVGGVGVGGCVGGVVFVCGGAVVGGVVVVFVVVTTGLSFSLSFTPTPHPTGALSSVSTLTHSSTFFLFWGKEGRGGEGGK